MYQTWRLTQSLVLKLKCRFLIKWECYSQQEHKIGFLVIEIVGQVMWSVVIVPVLYPWPVIVRPPKAIVQRIPRIWVTVTLGSGS